MKFKIFDLTKAKLTDFTHTGNYYVRGLKVLWTEEAPEIVLTENMIQAFLEDRKVDLKLEKV